MVLGRLLNALKSNRREKIPLAPQLCLQQTNQIYLLLAKFFRRANEDFRYIVIIYKVFTAQNTQEGEY